MKQSTVARGRRYEELAAHYLREAGLEVIERGYRCRLGELDLICRDGPWLVVVEVRARATTRYAGALESIGRTKTHRIIQATRHYLMYRRDMRAAPLRFDVVAIDAIETGEPRINWVRNAFTLT